MKKAKIGIMGGTFNPIHNGHIALAQTAFDFCELDEVWFMPSGVSYFKKHDNVVSGKHRLEMTKIAIKGYPGFKCSDMEVNRKGNTYTADTLKLLHEMHPENKFYFIMGADSLFDLTKWQMPDVIASLCTIATVVREDVDMQSLKEQKRLLERTLQADIVLVPFRKIDISSSDIRARLSRGEGVKDMVPDAVLSYIRTHDLYREA